MKKSHFSSSSFIIFIKMKPRKHLPHNTCNDHRNPHPDHPNHLSPPSPPTPITPSSSSSLSLPCPHKFSLFRISLLPQTKNPCQIQEKNPQQKKKVARIEKPNSLQTYLAFDFTPAIATSFPLSSPKTDTYTLTT